MKKITIIIISFILVYFLWLNIYQNQASNQQIHNIKLELLISEEKKELIKPNKKGETNTISDSDIKIKEIENKIKIKDNVNLEVQFYPQSPFWKWWEIFSETCEEASALIAINFVQNNKISRGKFRDKLLELVEWQNRRFWDYKHTDVNQTSIILKEFFNFSDFKIIDNPSINDIKTELSLWNIIIAPFYWVWLNPNYSWKGPDYHFMVIKWYSGDLFITHDVWTKHWKDYKYNQKMLLERLHDYDKTNIKNWEKRLIVLNKSN